MKAVFSIDAKLINHLKSIFTPILLKSIFTPILDTDKQNQKITNLVEFSEVFLSKCKLAKMINRYMVLVQSEQKLMMMRLIVLCSCFYLPHPMLSPTFEWW
jgi:hypothetical protein